MVQQLAAIGVETKVTTDGTEGVQLARTMVPNAIVLCVELNRISGYSICNKLKKDPELGRIPLILTSSQATEETFEQHKKLKTRAEAYLKKPYSDEELLGVLSPYLGGGASDEMEVALDELSVDMDDIAPEAPSPGAGVEQGFSEPTTVMPAAKVAQTLASPARPASVPPPPAPAPAPRAAGAEAQVEQLRAEARQLRQKVQKLEETIERNELAFNDRLLAESARGREGADAKKKLAALERDLAKYKEIAEKAQAELAAERRELDEVREASKTGDDEKQTLATKVGQLVDKVKSLAAERDALRADCDRLMAEQATAVEERENLDKAREKAKKAVEIAMQLVEETGLSN